MYSYPLWLGVFVLAPLAAISLVYKSILIKNLSIFGWTALGSLIF